MPPARVSDIMSRDVFTLSMDVSAEEAAWALTRRKISGAPVLDSEGNLAGFLSKSDLMNPEPDTWIKRKEATVGDLMFPDVIAVFSDDPAMKAVQGMAEKEIHHVVVIGEDGRLAGIVSAFDVIKALARGVVLGGDLDPDVEAVVYAAVP